ncbi:MAG: hypothetical protein H0V89_00125 [Deltaproteobacteria bacterium]|nr:hypothetical protein [Deltaproteobacteria bacterium]
MRPYPHISYGLRPVQLTGGWLFPHHPAVGLQGGIDLIGSLELRASGTLGLGQSGERDDGTAFETDRIGWIAAGVGARL